MSDPFKNELRTPIADKVSGTPLFTDVDANISAADSLKTPLLDVSGYKKIVMSGIRWVQSLWQKNPVNLTGQDLSDLQGLEWMVGLVAGGLRAAGDPHNPYDFANVYPTLLTMDGILPAVKQIWQRVRLSPQSVRNDIYQSGNPHRSIAELISNSLDAGSEEVLVTIKDGFFEVLDFGCGMDEQTIIKLLLPKISGKPDAAKTMGRFGVGFYTVLRHLQNEGDSVVVETKTKGGKAYQLNFVFYKGEIRYASQEINTANDTSHFLKTVKNSGTRIRVKSATIQKNEIENTARHFFQYAGPYKKIRVNEELIHSQTETTLAAAGNGYVSYDPTGPSRVVVVAGDATIESHDYVGHGALKGTVVLHRPTDVGLSLMREEVGVDDRFLKFFENAVDMKNEFKSRAEKIAYINSLLPLAKAFESNGRNKTSKNFLNILKLEMKLLMEGMEVYPDTPGMVEKTGITTLVAPELLPNDYYKKFSSPPEVLSAHAIGTLNSGEPIHVLLSPRLKSAYHYEPDLGILWINENLYRTSPPELWKAFFQIPNLDFKVQWGNKVNLQTQSRTAVSDQTSPFAKDYQMLGLIDSPLEQVKELEAWLLKHGIPLPQSPLIESAAGELKLWSVPLLWENQIVILAEEGIESGFPGRGDHKHTMFYNSSGEKIHYFYEPVATQCWEDQVYVARGRRMYRSGPAGFEYLSLLPEHTTFHEVFEASYPGLPDYPGVIFIAYDRDVSISSAIASFGGQQINPSSPQYVLINKHGKVMNNFDIKTPDGTHFRLVRKYGENDWSNEWVIEVAYDHKVLLDEGHEYLIPYFSEGRLLIKGRKNSKQYDLFEYDPTNKNFKRLTSVKNNFVPSYYRRQLLVQLLGSKWTIGIPADFFVHDFAGSDGYSGFTKINQLPVVRTVREDTPGMRALHGLETLDHQILAPTIYQKIDVINNVIVLYEHSGRTTVVSADHLQQLVEDVEVRNRLLDVKEETMTPQLYEAIFNASEKSWQALSSDPEKKHLLFHLSNPVFDKYVQKYGNQSASQLEMAARFIKITHENAFALSDPSLTDIRPRWSFKTTLDDHDSYIPKLAKLIESAFDFNVYFKHRELRIHSEELDLVNTFFSMTDAELLAEKDEVLPSFESPAYKMDNVISHFFRLKNIPTKIGDYLTIPASGYGDHLAARVLNNAVHHLNNGNPQNYLRELIQNSLDIQKDIADFNDHRIETNYYAVKQNDQTRMHILVRDYGGMSEDVLVRDFIIPEEGRVKNENDRGGFKMGFFSTLANAEWVRVKTCQKGSNTILLAEFQVERDTQGTITNIKLKLGKTLNKESFYGTQIESRRYVKNDYPFLDAARAKVMVEDMARYIKPDEAVMVVNGKEIIQSEPPLAIEEWSELGVVELYDGAKNRVLVGSLPGPLIDPTLWQQIPKGIRDFFAEHGFYLNLDHRKVLLNPTRERFENHPFVMEALIRHLPGLLIKGFLERVRNNEAQIKLPEIYFHKAYGLAESGTRLDSQVIEDSRKINFGETGVDYDFYQSESKLVELLTQINFVEHEGQKYSLSGIYHLVQQTLAGNVEKQKLLEVLKVKLPPGITQKIDYALWHHSGQSRIIDDLKKHQKQTGNPAGLNRVFSQVSDPVYQTVLDCLKTLLQFYDLSKQRHRRVEGEAPAALPMEGATRAPLIDFGFHTFKDHLNTVAVSDSKRRGIYWTLNGELETEVRSLYKMAGLENPEEQARLFADWIADKIQIITHELTHLYTERADKPGFTHDIRFYRDQMKIFWEKSLAYPDIESLRQKTVLTLKSLPSPAPWTEVISESEGIVVEDEWPTDVGHSVDAFAGLPIVPLNVAMTSPTSLLTGVLK